MSETDKIDKLIKRAVSVIDNSPDVSLDILERALSKAKDIHYLQGEAASLYQIGRVYVVLGNYKESAEKLKMALVIYEKLNDGEARINILSLLGMNYSYLGIFAESLDNLELSLSLAKELSNESMVGKILNNIAGVYYSKDDLPSAEKYYLMSLPIKEKLQDLKGLGACYTNLAIINSSLKRIPEAYNYINKAIEIKRNFINNYKDEGSLAFSQNILGLLKREEKKYTDALKIFEEVLAIYLRQNNLLMLCETYIMIATTYLEIHDVPNALKTLNAGEQFAKDINASRITSEFKELYQKANEMKS